MVLSFPAALRASSRAVGVVAVIGGGALAAVVLGAVRWMAPSVHRPALAVALRLWCRAALRALGIVLTVEGRPAPDGTLIVANHVSWLDVLVIGACGGHGFVAKSEVGRWPALGWLAGCADTLFLVRGDRASAARTAERIAFRLRAGAGVVLFPEGTTSRGERVGAFRHRLLAAASHVHALVQPVALAYGPAGGAEAPFVGDDAFLPHLVRQIALPRTEAQVRFGRPRLAATDGRTLSLALESDVRALHLSLRPGPGPDRRAAA
jgi:1-acyl-sn-glycerol-3-phosphate acyltransferase